MGALKRLRRRPFVLAALNLFFCEEYNLWQIAGKVLWPGLPRPFPLENFVHVAARFSRVRDLWKSACAYYLLFLALERSSGVLAKWIKPFKRLVMSSKLANGGRCTHFEK